MSTAPSHLLMSTPAGPSGGTELSPMSDTSLPKPGRTTAARATVETATGDGSGVGVGVGCGVG